MARVSLAILYMAFCRKCLNSAQNLRLLFSLLFAFLAFDSVCVYANSQLCTRVFGPDSHPFYQHLFSEDPSISPLNIEQQASLNYHGSYAATNQIGFSRKRIRRWSFPFKIEPMNWGSKEHLNPQGATPQGDVRNFIYVAGQELAQRFGFEFRLVDDHVVLLVPDADRIAKIVDKLNPILVSRRCKPIPYLPVRSGFSRPGATLAISNSSKGLIKIQFPYADRDPDLAAHEVSYHLGALLFGTLLMEKAEAINHESARVAELLASSGIQKADVVAKQLIKWREAELDAGTGNLQVNLANNHKFHHLKKYSEIEIARFRQMIESVVQLSHPFLTPTEVVAMQIMHLSKTQAYFSHIDTFSDQMDYLSYQNGVKSQEINLASEAQLAYVPFVRKLLNSQNENPLNKIIPPRQHAGVWTMEVVMGMDQRIKELLEASDVAGI